LTFKRLSPYNHFVINNRFFIFDVISSVYSMSLLETTSLSENKLKKTSKLNLFLNVV